MREIDQCVNVFTLKRPSRFANTTKVFALEVNLPANEYGDKLFSGYLFRGDKRPPSEIFETGFAPWKKENVYIREVSLDQRMADYTGSRDGCTRLAGVSTTPCAHAAQQYLGKYGVAMGYIYLIDARFMAGYAMPTPRPRQYPATRFRVLRKIYEVNFTHKLPASNIVGVVWSAEFMYSDIGVSAMWPDHINELKLGENKGFEGGTASVEEVVRQFNT